MHGGLAHNHKTVIDWIESEEIESPQIAAERLAGTTASWFRRFLAKRGIQGMIYTIQYAREK